MKEIGIANTIVRRRHEMGVTQDELANSLGVTKASVSKWETGMSYPDIAMLPRLAAYFNVTIDELLNYTPQLTSLEIAKIYRSLAERIVNTPFNEIYIECEGLIKKYYSCFPFLLQICILYLNHFPMAGNTEASIKILKEICDLCKHVKSESEDADIIKESISVEAIAHMMLSQTYATTSPDLMQQELVDVFDLLGTDVKYPYGDGDIRITAYQLQGNIEKATALCQTEMYLNLMNLLSFFPRLLTLYNGQTQRQQEIIHRCNSLINLFQLEYLNPNGTAIFYYCAACTYMTYSDKEQALQMLERYTVSATNLFKNLTLHGDDFFNQIDKWLSSYSMGIQTPRSRPLIYDSIIQGVENNPVFEELRNEPKYNEIIAKLRRIKEC